MAIAVLFPRYDHPAIEERYANWQSELYLRRQGDAVEYYDTEDPSSMAVADIETEHVLVVTDPLILAPTPLASRLLAILGDADAAVPSTNETENPAQHQAAPKPYMTVRELESVGAELNRRPQAVRRVQWDASDPGLFLCRTSMLASIDAPMEKALRGKSVVVSDNDYVHRWASMRGQVREDLLSRIGTDAKSILEFGCGEGTLGHALKQRQKCRVVGIEMDPDAAAIAQRRIDAVLQGDVREIVSILHEQFDWIVGGDIVEHLDEPWSFLAELRRISTPGGKLLLSLPNLANGSVVRDLLEGRFDYVYMGLTCAGHVRFFTRRSIEDLLAIAGWTPVEITPQLFPVTPEAEELMTKLSSAGIPFSREDLTASGYYVIARNG